MWARRCAPVKEGAPSTCPHGLLEKAGGSPLETVRLIHGLDLSEARGEGMISRSSCQPFLVPHPSLEAMSKEVRGRLLTRDLVT